MAPFLLPANGQPVSLIETPGNHLPVGVLSNAVYQEMSFSFNSGDVLVFYTDGLVEQKISTSMMTSLWSLFNEQQKAFDHVQPV